MKTIKQCPTQSELKELFDYNPETGNLIWKIKMAKKIRIGNVAGYLKSSGYFMVGINALSYLNHRIIWIWNNGEIPDGYTIDHINGITHDNRLSNLRLATPSQNCQNTNIHKDNKTGVKGLSELVNKKTGKTYWYCRVGFTINGNYTRKSKMFPFTESQKPLAIDWLEQTRYELHCEFANHGTTIQNLALNGIK